MCGRYYFETDDAELADICEAVRNNIVNTSEQLSFDVTSGEVFPTNIVPVRTGVREYRSMRWGFTGYTGRPIINARSETAHEKPIFRKPMQIGRCLVPASGYFEWKQDGKKKLKHAIYSSDSRVIYMAGCYRIEQGSELYSFVILTRTASAALQEIHERMPVIIPVSRVEEWLCSGSAAMEEAIDNLKYNKVCDTHF